MWELDYKESWARKNWYFWTVVLEKTLESPLDCTKIQPVHPKGNQSWIFIGRTDTEAETPKLQYFGHLMWRTDSFEKTLILGKIEGGRRKGQQRMRWLDGITDQWTWVWVSPGVGEGQGSLACCSPWSGRVRHDWATELNWTENLIYNPNWQICNQRTLFTFLVYLALHCYTPSLQCRAC